VSLLKNRGGAADRRPSPHSRARWGTLIAGVGVLIIIGGTLINRTSDGSDEQPRPVSKTEYELAVHSAYAGVREAFRATDVRPAFLAARVAAAQDELRKAAKKLGDLAPPKEIRDENLVLAAALEEYADDLEEVRQAAAAGNAQRIAAFSANVSRNPAIKKIVEAAEEMTRKGYDLGRLAED
jgi:phage terminase small subunit